MTGALSRTGLALRLRCERAGGWRNRVPLALVLLEIDEFAEVTEQLGRVAGDALLCDLVAQWRAMLRTRDAVGRPGDHQFALLLPDTDSLLAEIVAQRLVDTSPIALRYGVSMAALHQSLETSLAQADHHMSQREADSRSPGAGLRRDGETVLDAEPPMHPGAADLDGDGSDEPGIKSAAPTADHLLVESAIEPSVTEAAADGAVPLGDGFEVLVRRLLELLGRLTGMQSTYLTAIEWDQDAQQILFSHNTGAIEIPEGLRVEWSDTLCRRALEGGPACTTEVDRIYPDSAAARELGITTYVTFPVRRADGTVFGTLCAADDRRLDISPDALAVMEAFTELVALHLSNSTTQHELADANRELSELAYVDSLTGVGNRRAFERSTTSLQLAHERFQSPISVLAVDVDLFKSINDNHGHAVGDEVLREVARRLVVHTRPGDVVARLGGDELVAILVGASEGAALGTAERLRADIAATPIATDHGTVAVTISIGVAGCRNADINELLRRADTALYATKAAGRNGVSGARQLPGQRSRPLAST